MNTKSLLTKVAVPVLSLGLLGGSALALAGPASAAVNPGGPVTGTVTCTAANSASLGGGTVTNHNLDVPAGASCDLQYATVNGNVSVEGSLRVISSTFMRNVSVNGGTFAANNRGSTVVGNMSITNSPGNPGGDVYGINGFYNDAPNYANNGDFLIEGNFSYLNNSGKLYTGPNGGFGVTVNGNFTYAGNVNPAPVSGLTVLGTSSIS